MVSGMARPWRVQYAGAKYHVTSRGNGCQAIFLTDRDRLRFLDQLDAALENDHVVLYAYVLMRTHWHLFVETPRGNIDRFMQRLSTAYSMYFRYKHARPGHCLQGRYKAKVVGGDAYIVRLTRYIHLNPVKTETMRRRSMEERKAYLAGYRWSSYPGYVAAEREEPRVDYRWRRLMSRKTTEGDRAAYRRYVDGMVGRDDEVLRQVMETSRYAIGDEAFVAEAEAGLREAVAAGTVRADIDLPEPPRVYNAHRNGPARAHPNGPKVWLDRRASVG
jgi:REP element-mobilizing transposase RayT